MKFLVTNVTDSVVLVHARDTAAKQWLADTAPEDAQFFGNALAVEPRYLQGVINAVCEAGGEFE